MEALRRHRASTTLAVEAVGVGPPVPRHLRRHADALRGLRGVARRARPRRPARHRAPAARRREAAADAVEPARRAPASPACSPGSTTRRGSTSCTPSPPRRRPRRRGHLRLRRPGGGRRRARGTCGPPSSTPRSRARTGLAILGQLRRPAPPRPRPAAAGAVMELYPAIDLRDGRCVRLYQGDYDRETVYGDDPVAPGPAVRRPTARRGSTSSTSTPPAPASPSTATSSAAIAAAVDVPVQTGGGVRDEAAADALFDAGVARVVLGTAALEDPGLVRRLAARQPGGGRPRRPGPGRGRAGLGGGVRAATCSTLAAAFGDAGRRRAGRHRDRPRRHAGRARPRRAWPRCWRPPSIAGDRLRRRRHARRPAGARRAATPAVARLAGAIVGRALYEGAFTVADAVGAVAGGRA